MPYTVACIRAMTENFDVEVHLVRWDSKVLTPYSPPPINNVSYYLRSVLDVAKMKKLLSVVDPDLVFASGWMDKDYLKVCRNAKRNGIPVVTSADTHWRGSIKQRLGAIYSHLFFSQYFDFIMIPGAAQFEFARRLGFKNNQIVFNFYSADVDFYSGLYTKHLKKKAANYPKNILFLGRFAEEKNIRLLINSFEELQGTFHDWNLVLVGNGPLEKSILPTPRIQIHSFLPPELLEDILANTGVFCLPSRSEPWGVVVHEMAAYGLPIIVSDASGAGYEFVRNGLNGYRFRSESSKSISFFLRKLMSMNSVELQAMGSESNKIAQHINTRSWASELFSLM